MVYGTYNYSIHGVYKPSNITGGPHIVETYEIWKLSGKNNGKHMEQYDYFSGKSMEHMVKYDYETGRTIYDHRDYGLSDSVLTFSWNLEKNIEKHDPEETLESRKFGRKLEETSLNCHPGNVFLSCWRLL